MTKPISRLDLDALDSDPPRPRWLIEGWIRKHDLVIVSGEPGAAKSWLALFAALKVTSGGQLFLWNVTSSSSQNKVLYIDEDMNRYDAQERFQHLAAGLGEKPSKWHGLIDYWTENGFTLNSIVERSGEIKEFGPALVIVDSMYCINEYDMNELQYVRKVKSRLRGLMKEADCSLMILHHLRKSQPGQDRVKTSEDMLGSVGYRNMADAVIFMEWVDARKRVAGVKVRLDKQRGLSEEVIENQKFRFKVNYLGEGKGTRLDLQE